MMVKIVLFLFGLLFCVVTHSQNNDGSAQLDDILTASDEILLYLEPYNYDTENRRNPFEKYIFNEDSSSAGATLDAGSGTPVMSTGDEDTSIPILPLQQYELEKIKLIGIMWNIRDPKILVEDPTGRKHILKRNDRLGERNGYIAAIRENEIVIVQSSKKDGEKVKYDAKVINLK